MLMPPMMTKKTKKNKNFYSMEILLTITALGVVLIGLFLLYKNLYDKPLPPPPEPQKVVTEVIYKEPYFTGIYSPYRHFLPYKPSYHNFRRGPHRI